MTKKYRVTLSAAERDELAALIRKEKADARKLAHARVLLPVDESTVGASGTDEQVAQVLKSEHAHRRACARAFCRAGLVGRPAAQTEHTPR